MDVRVGDILVMKKVHPGCGSDKMLVQRCGADFRLCCQGWLVLRVGMDFKLRCQGCGHVFMIPRSKCEKKIRSVLRETESSER